MMNYEIFKEVVKEKFMDYIGGSYGAGTYRRRTDCSYKQPER